MKKTLIALAAIATAASVHAAAVDWKMTINGATSAGITGDAVGKYTAYMYDAGTWAQALKDGKLVLAASLDSAGFVVDNARITTGQQSFSTDAASVSYKLILVDTENDKWALVNEGSIASYDPESSSGASADSTTTGLRVLGTASSDNLTWNSGTVAAPEPTSGLLMVLGLTGLALKRKRA